MEANEVTKERILGLINKKGISDSTFADGIGVTKYVVSHWKCGISTSFNKYLPAIADYFHVTVDYLTGKEPDEEESNILSSIQSRAELKRLFEISMGASKQDVENAIKIMEALKK